MVLGKPLVVVSTLLALVAGGVPASAAPAERGAAREVPPGLAVSAPPTYAGAQAPVSVTLADEAGEPVAATFRCQPKRVCNLPAPNPSF